MNFHFTAISKNSKVGAIPTTMSDSRTCPDVCPLKGNGCYAESGPISWGWKKVNNGTMSISFDALLGRIKKIHRGTLWRHNTVGDLVGHNDIIDVKALESLYKANKGKKGYTYTHYDVLSLESNARAVKEANDNGFTINVSANNFNHADKLVSLGIAPVVTVLPMDAPKVSYTDAGNKVVVCPAQTRDKVNCANCGLCQLVDRSYIIGFLAHGSRKKKANEIAIG